MLFKKFSIENNMNLDNISDEFKRLTEIEKMLIM